MVVVAAEVGEPVPAVHALAADDEAVAEGCDGLEEGFGGGGEVAAESGLSVAVEDDEEEGPGVQVHAGVESDIGGRLEAAHVKASGWGWCEGRRRVAPSIFAGESLHEYPAAAADRGMTPSRGMRSPPPRRRLSGLFGDGGAGRGH